MVVATEAEKAQLLTALNMAIRQIKSGDYDVESTVETMPIPAGVNVKGFTKYTTGISGIEFSLVRNGQYTQEDVSPAQDQADREER